MRKTTTLPPTLITTGKNRIIRKPPSKSRDPFSPEKIQRLKADFSDITIALDNIDWAQRLGENPKRYIDELEQAMIKLGKSYAASLLLAAYGAVSYGVATYG